MQDVLTKASRKELMGYMAYLCRQHGISSSGDIRITISTLAGQDMSLMEGLHWLAGQKALYPQTAVLPADRPRAPTPQPQAAERLARKRGHRAKKSQLRRARRAAERAERRAQIKAAPKTKVKAKKRGIPGTPESRREAAMRKVGTAAFYKTQAWRELRTDALAKLPKCCVLCGRTRERHDIVLHVDHIKPLARFPHLALTFANLQILCEDCNVGKGARYTADWRPTSSPASPAHQESGHTPQAEPADADQGVASR